MARFTRCSVLLSALAAGPAAAADPGERQLTVEVGSAAPVGPAPVRNLICDDGSVVAPVDTPMGTALEGRRPGTTLCSFTDATSVRRVYRVTVVPPPPGAPDGGAGPRGPGQQ
jgi:hypothetical protein